jgi:cytochrome P450
VNYEKTWILHCNLEPLGGPMTRFHFFLVLSSLSVRTFGSVDQPRKLTFANCLIASGKIVLAPPMAVARGVIATPRMVKNAAVAAGIYGKRLGNHFRGINPFEGDITPTRVSLFNPFNGRPSWALFPHPGNYKVPLDILESVYWGADKETGSGKHVRYVDVPGMGLVLMSRDMQLNRAILTDTGDKAGEFNRATNPSEGIAESTGPKSVLFANGADWAWMRKALASAFGKTGLYQEDVFQSFQKTATPFFEGRIGALREHFTETGKTEFETELDSEIKPIMLEMLTRNFLGTDVDSKTVRDKYIPALEKIIDNLVSRTIYNQVPGLSNLLHPKPEAEYKAYQELTDLVLAARHEKKGAWAHFKPEAVDPTRAAEYDEALESNLKVILAGALEATSSWAGWVTHHLARNPEMQEKIYEEIKDMTEFTPANLEKAPYLNRVLKETLRLTPSLYFLPRRSTENRKVVTADGRTIVIPKDTMILLDIWHQNRHEDHWGIDKTGFPATEFHPERWEAIEANPKEAKNFLHMGFGHGRRVCPGQHLGQMETALVIAGIVKNFKFTAPKPEFSVIAGVSTKAGDRSLVKLQLRDPQPLVSSSEIALEQK